VDSSIQGTSEPRARLPRWVKISGVIAIIVVVLLVLVLLLGGEHGPSRHTRGTAATTSLLVS
jgi:hypothetical protein